VIDFNAAKEIARRYIAGVQVTPGVELVLIEERIIERPFGWVFFFDSKRYLETRDRKYTVLGAPFIVDRRDGSLHPLKTAPPVQYYIEQYEREHPIGGPVAEAPHAAAARGGSRPPTTVLIAIAVLLIGGIAFVGWHKLRQSTRESVPALTQYAPKDSHIVQSVSLSSTMGQDFDTARVGTKFDSGIKSAVLWYRWSSAAPGALLQIAWSKDGSEILQQQVQIATSSGEQAFALRTPDGAALPDGHYQVTLLEAGKPVTSIPFQIGR